jgi:hypothetical protein
MLKVSFRRLAVAAVVILMAAPMVATAQDTAGSAASGSQGLTKAQIKAQRKAARKEARAKKNAELKKLEAGGYNPAARSDLDYPQNLQNAQKKAATPGAASQ